MTTRTFTFRQLEADPTLCKGMKRLWQDSEGKTVTYQVPEPVHVRNAVNIQVEDVGIVDLGKGTKFNRGDHLALNSDGKLEIVKPMPKAKGKKK